MIIDALSPDTPAFYDTDFCVVGGGIVGIAIARRLVSSGRSVLIVESGDEEFEPDTQDLCEMEIKGLMPENDPLVSRLRFLGGSGNHWGGWNIPFSKAVLDQWPANYDFISSYFPETRNYLDLREGDQSDLSNWKITSDQYIHDYGSQLQIGVRQVRSLNPWHEYGGELKNASNCKIISNANLVDFQFGPSNDVIQLAVLRTLSGKTLTVRAQNYIMACGGLENPVILLNIDRQHNGLLSRKSPVIGKYYMDHLHIYGQMIPITCFTPKFADWTELDDYDAAEDDRYYHVRPFAIAKGDYADESSVPHEIDLGNFHTQCEYITEQGFYNGLSRILEIKEALTVENVTFNFGSTPTKQSYIALSDRENALGQKVGSLHWNILRSDLEMVYELMKLYEKRFASAGLARIRISEQFKREYLEGGETRYSNGRHHMGATRMSTRPEDGVVDENCRMHGLQNLYISGASVFPSIDWPGPTFTAVALSLRLADHLLIR